MDQPKHRERSREDALEHHPACFKESSKVIDERHLRLSDQEIQSSIFRIGIQGSKHISPPDPNLELLYGVGNVRAFVCPVLQNGDIFEGYKHRLKDQGHQLAIISPVHVPLPSFNLQHKEFGTINISLGRKTPINLSSYHCSILQAVFVILMDERWRRRTKNMFFATSQKEEYRSAISPYLVGITSADGLLDWELMDLLIYEAARSKEERIAAARLEKSAFNEARIWAPIYDELVPYVVFDTTGETCASPFPSRREGVDSFQDYFLKCRNFEVPVDSLLFNAQKLWWLPRNLPLCKADDTVDNPRESSRITAADSMNAEGVNIVKIAQHACFELRLANAPVALMCLMLPQILYIYESYATATELIRHCSVHLPILGFHLSNVPLEKVVECLNASSSTLPESYDVLEYFGDAVLKIVQTDALVKSNELRLRTGFVDEGAFSILRSGMSDTREWHSIRASDKVSIASPSQLWVQINDLPRFVIGAALERGKWLPCCMTFKQNGNNKNDDNRDSKVDADVVEALLGLVFLECGWDIAQKVADELDITVSWNDTEHPKRITKDTDRRLRNLVSSCTGYSDIQRIELAEEALTHPTFRSTEVPSYQRLEWIGDAVLCMAIRKWIYYNLREGASIGTLVEVDAALVSNETLAFLCGKYGLQHHINHSDPDLEPRMENYVRSVSELGNGLWCTDPPKSMSDIAESLLGAVHMDGGFAAGQSACLRFMSPLLNVLLEAQSLKKEIRLKHPRKAITEIAGDLFEIHVESEPYFALAAPKVDVLFQGGNWGPAKKESDSFVASVTILGSILLAVADPSARVAKNKVCAIVVTAVETNPRLLDRLQTCFRRIESTQSPAKKTPAKWKAELP
eukprot:scaffold721_cov131-Cylindrotheca_fusiformis.AAC.28